MKNGGDILTEPVAILGAGPVGLEAALACVERGLPFVLYEASTEVGANIRGWGHVELFSPWSMNVSPRMRRHLASDFLSEQEEECPTGNEFVDRLLRPLSLLPALREGIRYDAEVVAVSREGLLKHHEIGTSRRKERPFRILLRDRGGREWTERASAVLDCTGTWRHPNALGDGGIPAPGERALDERIRRTIPDLAREREQWEGRRVLLVGGGHSAQTAVRDLADLATGGRGARVLWAVRSEAPDWGAVPDDPLPRRGALTGTAEELARGNSRAVEPRLGSVVDSLEPVNGRTRVQLRREDGSTEKVEVDRILSLTGSVGDHGIYRQLQVHECYATSGPMSLAAALLGAQAEGADCLAQESHGPDTLLNPEPGFFILGQKSYGRNNTFLLRVGWSQVDEAFQSLDGFLRKGAQG